MALTDVSLDPEGIALPGKSVALVARKIEQPNPVSVTVSFSRLVELKSQDADCGASLGEGVKYVAAEDFVLEPGSHENVVLGAIRLSGALSNRCQGAELEGIVQVVVSF